MSKKRLYNIDINYDISSIYDYRFLLYALSKPLISVWNFIKYIVEKEMKRKSK